MQKPGSSNTVEESFFIDSITIQVFDKSIYSDLATAHDPDSQPREATLKSWSTFYYGLSENYFGTQAVKPSTVIDVLPRAGKTVSPVSGDSSIGGAAIARDVDVKLTGAAQDVLLRADLDNKGATIVSPIDVSGESGEANVPDS